MAVWGIGIMMAPILGPTVGGWIVRQLVVALDLLREPAHRGARLLHGERLPLRLALPAQADLGRRARPASSWSSASARSSSCSTSGERDGLVRVRPRTSPCSRDRRGPPSWASSSASSRRASPSSTSRVFNNRNFAIGRRHHGDGRRSGSTRARCCSPCTPRSSWATTRGPRGWSWRPAGSAT